MKDLIDYIVENSQVNSDKSLLNQGYLFDKIRIHGFNWYDFNKYVDLSEYKDKLKDKNFDHPQLGWWTEISTGQGKHIGNNLSATFTSKRDLKWDRMDYIVLAPMIYCLLCEPNGIEIFSELCKNEKIDVETKIRGKQITVTIIYSSDRTCKITFKK